MHLHTTRGFTLVEVVIAVLLVIAAAVGAASLFVASGRAVATSRTATVASLLAREKMERLRALPLDDPELTPAAADSLATPVDGFWDAPLADYQRRWSVTPLPLHPAAAVILQVDVLRDGRGPAARLVTIQSRKAP